MSTRLKVNLAKYGGCAAFVALLVWAYLGERDFPGAERVDQYLMLCDAFAIPGLVLIMLGAMTWVSTTGALDGIAYCVRFAIYSLIPGKRLERDEKYGEYIERKSQNRAKGYAFLFWSGVVTMIISFVFMALFYSLYQK